MNKTQLIDTLAEHIADEAEKTGSKALSKADVVKVVNAYHEVVQAAVAAGDTVQIIGFGSFERRFREARTAPNPRGGAPVPVAAKHVPAFKPGSGFKATVSSSTV